ncbi:MAG TPA: MFS transporter [Mycobacterium sp.]|nr:MFS transporter [Mycobacterium sp.]
MEPRGAIKASPLRASVRALPRLSRRTGFWAVAFSFLVVAAFSTAPSSLYGLYEHQEHLSSLTITFVYAVYAVGIVVSLLLAGHVSDWYGRRAVLLPARVVAVVAAVVFLVWRSLAGLLVARVLTGLALGAAVATATAFVTDLDAGPGGVATRRAGIVATIANIGGLGVGPLIAGLLARYAAHPLTLPFIVFLALLAAATTLVFLAPEGHAAVHPRPRYHPQRLTAPANARRQFIAATTGAFTAFAIFGLFAGLAGAFLAGPLHHSSPALAGLTIFLTFGSGVLVQTMTTNWPAHRLVAAGIAPIIAGLGVLVASAWTSPPSLTLFLIAGVVIGAAGGAIFRGSLTVVISTSGPDDRAGALATFFTAGYAGVSLPVVGVGLALQHLSPRVTLLIFALAVALGILAAAPILVRPPAAPVEPSRPVSDLMTTMCRGFGARVDDAAGEPSHPAGGPDASPELRLERAPDQKIETREVARDPTGATADETTRLSGATNHTP